MIKVMVLVILSPLAIFCGILSIAIICVAFKKVINIYVEAIKTIIDRVDNKC